MDTFGRILHKSASFMKLFIIIGSIMQFYMNKGGFLHVCGDGSNGKLGISEYYNKECEKPTRVQSAGEIVDIAALSSHTMLVDCDGRVWAFGNGECGALGTGNNENVKTPQQIHLKHRAISVCVGARHSLILAESGSVLSCGDNTYSQLGHFGTRREFVPKIITALKEYKITQISAGGYHNDALGENGVLFMWGYNYFGQCGVGKEKGKHIYTPTIIKLNEKASTIESGYDHSLLITNKHLLYSFGGGDYYKLGHGTLEKKYVPTLIESLKDVNIINVAGGAQHTLGVDDKFNIWTFGSNTKGQCAHQTGIKFQATPKKIEYFSANKIKAKSVAAGDYSSCVITQNNECFVFGNNDDYQIGLKEKNDYFIPTKLPLSVQKASMGTNYSTFIG